MTTLTALTPLDGRYRKSIENLGNRMGEFGLIRARLTVMVEWVMHLSSLGVLPMRELTDMEKIRLSDLRKPTLQEAEVVKAIETTGHGKHGRTNHDVKACELYLRDRFEETTLGDIAEWIHFGLTSEDVNNLAYGLMLHGAVRDELSVSLSAIESELHHFAVRYAGLPMLARTHGQPASPTTLGKEFKVFQQRLAWQLDRLAEFRLAAKINGASGNYSALLAAFPDLDWESIAQEFITKLNTYLGDGWLEFNSTTTQIEPHDTYAELFQGYMRINVILTDFCQDIWRYVSDDWLRQRQAEGETGSSTMPHKVNPIDFENAEGNLGLANALFEYFCRKLPVSRLQRDLSDSTVERAFGAAFGHSLVAYKAIARGMGKVAADEEKILAALDARPEVVTEAYQTILRAAGVPNAYMLLKGISRGKTLTLEDLHAFVRDLDVAQEVKERMLAVTPRTYIGLAARIAAR